MSGVCFAGVEEGGAHCIEASVRRVSSKVFHAQCVPDYHHRCPPAGPRQENKPSQPPVAPDDSTPCRAKFGAFRTGSPGLKTTIPNPLISIAVLQWPTKIAKTSSEDGSGRNNGAFGQRKRPYKSCTCRPFWALAKGLARGRRECMGRG